MKAVGLTKIPMSSFAPVKWVRHSLLGSGSSRVVRITLPNGRRRLSQRKDHKGGSCGPSPSPRPFVTQKKSKQAGRSANPAETSERLSPSRCRCRCPAAPLPLPLPACYSHQEMPLASRRGRAQAATPGWRSSSRRRIRRPPRATFWPYLEPLLLLAGLGTAQARGKVSKACSS